MERLAGRVAIVTGVSGGMGTATARLFADEGAHVVGLDRSNDGGKELQREIGQELSYCHLDVVDEDGWQTFANDLMAL